MENYKISQEESEIRFAVEKINEKIYEEYEKKDKAEPLKDWLNLMPSIFVTTNDYIISVSLSIPTEDIPPIELHLYHTEDNDRTWCDDKNDYEPYLEYTKRKWLEIKNVINGVTF